MSQNCHEDDQTRSFTILSKGTMVSHYRIIEKIGAGGMGEVYLAEDTKLNRKVALKFLPQHLCQDEECRERFKREAQAAAKLNHPNIVTIYEVGEHQGRPFIAMEQIEGQLLKNVIGDESLSLDRITGLAIQICDGLSKAHNAGITHRDIKPSNIVIDLDGRPKLLDFGLAVIQGSDKLTKTGSTLGTIGYMSPEQAQGEKVDHRSDLFSLGVVLYEMITSLSPFKRDDDAATLHAIVHDTPEPLARYKTGVPDALQQVISRLLEKDVKLRFQSSADLVSELKRLRTGGYSSNRGALRSQRPWTRLVGVGLALAAVIAIVVAIKLITMDKGKLSAERKMLVVLPFRNLGSPEDQHFADGITDEITSRLSTIRGLGVISSTSAFAYKGSDKTLPDIAKELGCDFVLEGTIRWDRSGDTNKVRITPQLIRVSDDTHLWAHNYEEAVTEIFSVQANIATNVAKSLGIVLRESARQRLGIIPTSNLEAYEWYVRGRESFRQGNLTQEITNFIVAKKHFRKAIEIDPDFALAYNGLAACHMMVFSYIDPSENQSNLIKATIDSAMNLEPEETRIHLLLAIYYISILRDEERALKELEITQNLQPSNAQALTLGAFIKRKQGKWDEAIHDLELAMALEPINSNTFFQTGLTEMMMRNYEEAERLFDSCITLSPGDVIAHAYKVVLYWNWTGNTKLAREEIEKAKLLIRPDILEKEEALCDAADRNYNRALEKLGSKTLNREGLLIMAGINFLMGDTAACALYSDSARISFESMIKTTPEIHRATSYMGLAQAYAGMGMRTEALHWVDVARKLRPLEEDAFEGALLLDKLPTVYLLLGEHDLAIDVIEQLLSIPSGVSAGSLRIFPGYDLLRYHPRFQTLLKEYPLSR